MPAPTAYRFLITGLPAVMTLGGGMRGSGAVVGCVLAAVLAGVTGCNGSDSSSPDTSGTGFRSAYTAATNDYVKAAQETAQQAQDLKGNETATLKVYDELAAKVDAVRKRYAAMPTPAKVAPQVTVVIRLLSEQVTLLRRIAPDVRAKDSAAVQAALTALSRSAADLAQARVKLDAAVKACGSDCS